MRRCVLKEAQDDKKSGESRVLTFKNLTLNHDTRQVVVNDTEVTLTVKEFDILELLLHYPKKVFTRENLFTAIWGEDYFGEDNTVNVHISNLRQKLSKADKNTEYIKTVWGIGFKMALENLKDRLGIPADKYKDKNGKDRIDHFDQRRTVRPRFQYLYGCAHSAFQQIPLLYAGRSFASAEYFQYFLSCAQIGSVCRHAVLYPAD